MITPSESKEIRRSLSLSQKHVSENTAICNTDISKFECGRLVMKSKDLIKLADFYKAQLEANSLIQEPNNTPAKTPVETPADLKEEKTGQPFDINGFIVPDGFDIDEAAELMETYQLNQENVLEALQRPLERGIFGGINMDSIIRDLLVPMAANFAIIDRIHGNSEILALENPKSEYLSEEEGVETYQDAINHRLATPYTPA